MAAVVSLLLAITASTPAGASVGASAGVSASVVCPANRTSCVLQPGARAADAQAWGRFEDKINSTGWSQLWLTTPGADTDAAELVQGFAAGYLEGALTHTLIARHHANLRAELLEQLPAATATKLLAFVAEQDAWARARVREQVWQHRVVPAYWHTLDWLYAQLDGLAAGYAYARNAAGSVEPALGRSDFLLLQIMGDGEDLVNAVTDPAARPQPAAMTPAARARYERRHSHCSALVKVADDFSELWTGHTMWWGYYAMLRVLKHQSFAVRGWARPRMELQVAGYPGTLSSTDDFYQSPSTGLVVLETTIPVLNISLYDAVNTSSLLYWQRVMLANYLSADGAAWMRTFGQRNSGTYNNQWIVVDYGKLAPGRALEPGALTVGEQLPGFWTWADQTPALAAGHWASFNKAFYRATAQRSGQAAAAAKDGPGESWQMAKRAQIFRREVGRVRSVPDVQRFLRLNRYQTDPISAGHPCDTIACRGDLITGSPEASGATDGKVAAAGMLRNRTMAIVAGPTHDDQPVFDWATAPAAVRATPHAGQPQRFDFEWLNATM
eukprot:g7370.t1